MLKSKCSLCTSITNILMFAFPVSLIFTVDALCAGIVNKLSDNESTVYTRYDHELCVYVSPILRSFVLLTVLQSIPLESVENGML